MDLSSIKRSLSHMSVRTRIVGIMTVLALLSMTVAGFAAYMFGRGESNGMMDRNLRANLDSVRTIVKDRDFASADEALRYFVGHPALEDNSGTIGLKNGEVALVPALDMDLKLEEFPKLIDRVTKETENGEAIIGTFVEGKDAIRYLGVPIGLENKSTNEVESVVYVVAYDLDREHAELDAIALRFVLVAALLTLVAVLVGLWVSSRLLRPIRDMREVAQRVTASNVEDRIPVNGDDDVSQLAMTMNDMLDRIDEGFRSQRQLLQDVGHELNTPVTIVRGNLEVMDVENAEDVAQTRDLAIDELDRMAGLVNDIRGAARLMNAESFEFEKVQLPELMESLHSRLSATPGVEMTPLGEVPNLAITVDSARIAQVFSQFAENAKKYGAGPTSLEAGVGRDGDIELSYRDRGSGVPEEKRESIFERFNRGVDEGRGESGSGLGLAIVQTIVRRHGGSVWVQDAYPGAKFVVSLPKDFEPSSASVADGDTDEGEE